MIAFGRKYELAINFQSGESWTIDQSQFRIKIHLKQALKKEANQNHITILNLSADKRQTLHRAFQATVTLSAGYQDSLGVIFKGQIRRAYSAQDSDGVTWQSILECSDGESRMQKSRVKVSYSPSTPWSQIVKDVAKQIGFDGDLNGMVDQLIAEANANAKFKGDYQLPRGYSFSGSGVDCLNALLAAKGATFSVINGKFFFYGPTTLQSGPGLYLTEDSGIVGSPDVGTVDTATGTPTLKVKTLLNPNAIVGASLQIDRPDFEHQIWRIEVLEFVGDSMFGDWHNTYHCKKIQ